MQGPKIGKTKTTRHDFASNPMFAGEVRSGVHDIKASGRLTTINLYRRSGGCSSHLLHQAVPVVVQGRLSHGNLSKRRGSHVPIFNRTAPKE